MLFLAAIAHKYRQPDRDDDHERLRTAESAFSIIDDLCNKRDVTVMSNLPPVVRLDRSAHSMIFDLRRGAAELVWLGEPLPADQDLLALCNSVSQGRRPSQPDEPAPFFDLAANRLGLL